MLKHTMEYESHSEEDTAAIAAQLAAQAQNGSVYCLSGDLGAGKTVFARGFIRALSGDEAIEIPSPTFTLLQIYESAKGMIYHFDLYRIKQPEEIYEIGWEDALAGGIVLIEWPERLGTLLPEKRMDVAITQDTDETRKVVIHE